MVDSALDWQPAQLFGGAWLAMWSTGKMRIERVIWLDGIVEKLWRKHRVEQHEVVEVLDSRPLFRFVEAGHRSGEDLYLALGQSESGRYLSVFFIHKATKDVFCECHVGPNPDWERLWDAGRILVRRTVR